MIREVNTEDLEQIYKISRNELKGVELDDIKNVHKSAKHFIVWDEAGIKGFAYMGETNKEEGRWSVQLYVDSRERRKGIGTALYAEVQKYIEIEKPSVLVTEFRVDLDDPTAFYEGIRYKKWFGSPDMQYRGTVQPEVDLEFVNYKDKYYEQYMKCRQDCFYEIRRENDIEPYIISLSETDRKHLLSQKDSIYLTFDNGQLVGAITIKGGYLDNIMVAPAYQGMGYGKKITRFGINKVLSNKEQLIRLCYMEGNKRAENLYKSLGFEMLQNTHVYRKFMNL